MYTIHEVKFYFKLKKKCRLKAQLVENTNPYFEFRFIERNSTI